MKFYKLIFCPLLLLIPTNIFAKTKGDSIYSQKNIYKQCIPIVGATIGLGLALEYSTGNKHWWSNKYTFQSEATSTFSNVNTSIDDYFQFTSIALAAGLNIAGVKAQHKIGSQIARLALAEAIGNTVVYGLKTGTKHMRPNGSANNSFPSGHTAQAFLAARFVDKEFGKKNPWVSCLAYGMAATTGFCRVVKNKHWASDVLVGAGVGILSTEIAYFIVDKIEMKNFRVVPMFGKKKYGLSMAYTF